MIKKLSSLTILLTMAISSFLVAEIDYDIQDIGTLQTHSSKPIALNNHGQILGWFNIDGSNSGKYFFLKDKEGEFYGIPSKEYGMSWDIDWRYLTDEGKVYGTFDGNSAFSVLYMWDQYNGLVKLGNLPGKEISAINNFGQVLIKSVRENKDGKSISSPVIWENGKITKLHGLNGDLGIESEESYGFGMNNKGEVVGQSLVSICYKNKIHKQVHAAKWINGKAIDLHKVVPKSSTESSAVAINDLGDISISAGHNTIYFFSHDENKFTFDGFSNKLNDKYIYSKSFISGMDSQLVISKRNIENKINNDLNSIWLKIIEIISINNNGDIIATGETIYGEEHAMFLTPVKTN